MGVGGSIVGRIEMERREVSLGGVEGRFSCWCWALALRGAEHAVGL